MKGGTYFSGQLSIVPVFLRIIFAMARIRGDVDRMEKENKIRITSQYWLNQVRTHGGHFMILMRTNIAG